MISKMILKIFDVLLLGISILTIVVLGFANIFINLLYNIIVVILDISSIILSKICKILD